MKSDVSCDRLWFPVKQVLGCKVSLPLKAAVKYWIEFAGSLVHTTDDNRSHMHTSAASQHVSPHRNAEFGERTEFHRSKYWILSVLFAYEQPTETSANVTHRNAAGVQLCMVWKRTNERLCPVIHIDTLEERRHGTNWTSWTVTRQAVRRAKIYETEALWRAWSQQAFI